VHGDSRHVVATAGCLLRCDGSEVVILTPLAVVGSDAREVRTRLAQALEVPSADLELRAALARLETGMVRELRAGAAGGEPLARR